MRALALAVFLLGVTPCVVAARAQQVVDGQVVDGIAARIEDDIITRSQVAELAAYQQLVDGHSEPDAQILSELIEQWIVNNEATMARFPPAAQSEVSREVARVAGAFPNPEAYQQRLKELGIAPQDVQRIVAEQIYLARYLDYKFRPAIQVDDAAIQKYYDEQLVPALKAKNQAVPSLDSVRDQIREVLIEQGINDRAASWFDDTRSHLNIEIKTPGAAPVAPAAPGKP